MRYMVRGRASGLWAMSVRRPWAYGCLGGGGSQACGLQGEDVCLRWSSGQGSAAALTSVFTLPQSYIQSFRDRQTGSSLSSFMASPTDTDYEYGSRGPLTACVGPPVRV